MSQFKPGDRVVVTKALESFVRRYIGKLGEVREISPNNDTNTHVNFDDGTSYVFYEEELAIDLVYNSPLMKALS